MKMSVIRPPLSRRLAQPAVHRFQLSGTHRRLMADWLVMTMTAAAAGEAGDGIQAARYEVKLRPTLDVVRGVFIDDTVAVEEDGGTAHS